MLLDGRPLAILPGGGSASRPEFRNPDWGLASCGVLRYDECMSTTRTSQGIVKTATIACTLKRQDEHLAAALADWQNGATMSIQSYSRMLRLARNYVRRHPAVTVEALLSGKAAV